jgi:tetratricopeptide (TPR) repeat protein
LLHHWLEVTPKASRPLWLLGRCDLGDLKYAEGVAWLEKAVAKQPHNPNYLAFLGGGLLRVDTPGSHERAAKLLAQVVDLEPGNAEYRELYAQSLQGLGLYEEAWRQCLQALDADPYRISCYARVSELAWRLHRPGAAAFLPPVIRSVQQRLAEETGLWRRVWDHPDDADAHLKLARFLCRTAELTKADNQLEQALALRPGWPEARQLMATVQRARETL